MNKQIKNQVCKAPSNKYDCQGSVQITCPWASQEEALGSGRYWSQSSDETSF